MKFGLGISNGLPVIGEIESSTDKQTNLKPGFEVLDDTVAFDFASRYLKNYMKQHNKKILEVNDSSGNHILRLIDL